MTSASVNRRQFIAGSSAVLATGMAPAVLRPQGANDRIRVGIIGCGGRGSWVLGNLERLKESANVTVSGLCDVWRPAREKMAARVEKNFGTKPAVFARYADLLARDDVDAVAITTADFAHSPILIAAANAGKDAYCEKPMARTLEHANGALRAVRGNKRVVQIGTQRRSDGRFAAAAEFIQSGGLGKIVQINTAWHDNKPRWNRGYKDVKREDVDWDAYLMYLPKRPFDARRYRCWHLYKDYTVGTPGLLGSHLIDAATWFVNDPYPSSAVAMGGTYLWKDREHADTIECVWEYPSGMLLRYSTRLGNSKRVAEVVVYGAKGTFDVASFKAVPDGGGKQRLAEPVNIEAGPSENHVGNWLDCIRSRKDPNAPIELGHAHSVATIMAYEAWISGRRQVWDAKRMEIREA